MTKKRIFLVGATLGAAVMLVLAAAVPFQAFNTNQFNTNGSIVSIASPVILTNITLNGTLTAGANLFNSAGVTAGTATITTGTITTMNAANITDFNPTTNQLLTLGNDTGLTNIGAGVNGQVLVAKSTALGGVFWSNFPSGGSSFTPSVVNLQLVSSNLGSGTNVDCHASYMFARATTNTSIAFQLTNETDGATYSIMLFNIGATPPAQITISPSSGRTNNYVAGQATYAPSTNAILKIVVECWATNNLITFIDNYH